MVWVGKESDQSQRAHTPEEKRATNQTQASKRLTRWEYMSKNSMATSLNDRCVSRWRLMRLSASCGLSYAWVRAVGSQVSKITLLHNHRALNSVAVQSHTSRLASASKL